MASFVESATLKVVDQATGPINKINAALKKLQATANSLKNIKVDLRVNAAGIDKAIASLNKLKATLNSLPAAHKLLIKATNDSTAAQQKQITSQAAAQKQITSQVEAQKQLASSYIPVTRQITYQTAAIQRQAATQVTAQRQIASAVGTTQRLLGGPAAAAAAAGGGGRRGGGFGGFGGGGFGGWGGGGAAGAGAGAAGAGGRAPRSTPAQVARFLNTAANIPPGGAAATGGGPLTWAKWAAGIATVHKVYEWAKEGGSRYDIGETSLKMKQIDQIIAKTPGRSLERDSEEKARDAIAELGREKGKAPGGQFFNKSQRQELFSEMLGVTNMNVPAAKFMTGHLEDLTRNAYNLGQGFDQAYENAMFFGKGMEEMGRVILHGSKIEEDTYDARGKRIKEGETDIDVENDLRRKEAAKPGGAPYIPAKAGEVSTKTAERTIEYLQKLQPEIGREMTGRMFQSMAKYLRGSKYAISDRALGAVMLMGEEMGTSASVGYNQAVKQLSATRPGMGTTKAALARQRELLGPEGAGLLATEEVTTGKGKRRKTATITALEPKTDEQRAYRKMVQTDLPQAVMKYIVPALEAEGERNAAKIKARGGSERKQAAALFDVGDAQQVYDKVKGIVSDRTAVDTVMGLMYRGKEFQQKLDLVDLRSGESAEVRRITATAARSTLKGAENQIEQVLGETSAIIVQNMAPYIQGASDTLSDLMDKRKAGTATPVDTMTAMTSAIPALALGAGITAMRAGGATGALGSAGLALTGAAGALTTAAGALGAAAVAQGGKDVAGWLAKFAPALLSPVGIGLAAGGAAFFGSTTSTAGKAADEMPGKGMLPPPDYKNQLEARAKKLNELLDAGQKQRDKLQAQVDKDAAAQQAGKRGRASGRMDTNALRWTKEAIEALNKDLGPDSPYRRELIEIQKAVDDYQKKVGTPIEPGKKYPTKEEPTPTPTKDLPVTVEKTDAAFKRFTDSLDVPIPQWPDPSKADFGKPEPVGEAPPLVPTDFQTFTNTLMQAAEPFNQFTSALTTESAALGQSASALQSALSDGAAAIGSAGSTAAGALIGAAPGIGGAIGAAAAAAIQSAVSGLSINVNANVTGGGAKTGTLTDTA